MSTQIVHQQPPAPLDTFRDHVQLTAASPEVAASRPLSLTVESAIAAAAGKSVQTERAYRRGIFEFVQFLDSRADDARFHYANWFPLAVERSVGRRTLYDYNPDAPSAVLWLVNAGMLDAFALDVAERADGSVVAASTVEARVHAVRTFLRVALRDGVITLEQGQQMGLSPYRARRSRHQRVVGRRLSVAEVKKLRAAVDVSETRGVRDRALLDCMLYAGLRRSEVASLRGGDVVLDQGRYWLHVTGKGGKARKLKVHDVLYRSLAAWRAETGGDDADAPVFTSVDRWGNIKPLAIDPNVIERITAEYAHAAGIASAAGTGKLAPHDLRRTCARNAYDHGASLLQVQQMLGHADPKTTAAYIGAGEEEVTAVDCVRY